MQAEKTKVKSKDLLTKSHDKKEVIRNPSDSYVLIIDDEEISREILLSMLSDSFHCKALASGLQLIAHCEMRKPDLIILDMQMPEISGLDVCKALKQDDRFSDIPVIFVTANTDTQTQDACWEAGASDFVTKPVTPSTLRHRAYHQIQNKLRIDLLNHLTFHDQLTGAYNRHYLAAEIPQTIRQIARERGSVAVIMLDIDYFKGFNDTYGHLDGDVCLRSVAKAIEREIKRPIDCLIRYGGEEFCVLLPNTDSKGCRHVAENIVRAVRNLGINNVASPKGLITISAGYYVTSPISETDVNQIILEADLSLFDAKESGKNQVKGHSF